ncbi:cohesin domain-containing protein, partial [Herbivorax sp. ANBcel31]|uniref:cohesin domain-containing protein n=1 Tax=Herbivorax sp. ANBcel31 TaxID=3069754 RepID=UPI0027B8702E
DEDDQDDEDDEDDEDDQDDQDEDDEDDQDDQEIPEGFAVVVDTVSGDAGETVELPVRFSNVPSSGVNNCDFTLSYDDSVLEVEEVTVGAIVEGGSTDFGSNIIVDDSRVAFMFVDETGLGNRMIEADGVFATLTVKISETASDGLAVVELATKGAFADYDLNPLDVEFVSGGVNVGEDVDVPEDDGEYTVSGYVAPDFSYDSSVASELLAGFRVEVEGTDLYSTTDADGYFEINGVPENAQGHTLTITKQFYVTREITDVVVTDDVELSTSSSPTLMWAGDIVPDDALNMDDIMKAVVAFNTVPGDERYDEEADINKDGAVNLEDIMIIVRNFNKTSADYSN